MRLPDIPFIRKHKKWSAAIGIAILVLAAFPVYIGPTWQLFTTEPMVPTLRQHIRLPALGERRVGDVLQYIPTLVVGLLLLGIYVGSWRASPTAAPPTPTRSARKPSTVWKGLRWELDGRGRAEAFCGDAGHETYAILFDDGYRTSSVFTARVMGDHARLKCPAGDGHYVKLGDLDQPTYAQWESAATDASARIMGDRRGS